MDDKYRKIRNERDMLYGHINCMFATHDLKELTRLRYGAVEFIDDIFQYQLDQIIEEGENVQKRR